jgi:hypothetical protein
MLSHATSFRIQEKPAERSWSITPGLAAVCAFTPISVAASGDLLVGEPLDELHSSVWARTTADRRHRNVIAAAVHHWSAVCATVTAVQLAAFPPQNRLIYVVFCAKTREKAGRLY